MNIECAVALAQSGSVLQASEAIYRRPADFFKLRYARLASVCREYGRSIAVPAQSIPNYGGKAEAMARSTFEITPLTVAKAISNRFRTRDHRLYQFFHVDFDNTARVRLAVVMIDEYYGGQRYLELPKGKLQTRAHRPEDPAVLATIPDAWGKRSSGFEAWTESLALRKAIAAAFNESELVSSVQVGRRYYRFVRITGRTYLASTLWMDGGDWTRVYGFLFKLRPNAEGILMCGFSNAIPVAGCGGRGCS